MQNPLLGFRGYSCLKRYTERYLNIKIQPRLTGCGCAEERTFNYRIYKYKIPIFDIGHRFHYVPGREEERQKNDVPFIIHWAGGVEVEVKKLLQKQNRLRTI